jgi:inosine-uridine nucleoside N-ribohydrolase
MPKRHALLSALVLAAMAVGGCLGSTEPSPTPALTGAPAPDRRPVIIDADFDHSDIAAILVLLRDPALDLRAITIAGTVLVHCQGGRLVTRYLLEEMGQPDIPFGCGREDGGQDARPFPDDWRVVADAGYGLDITPRVEAGAPRDAVDLLREAVDQSPSAPTIVTLGPLTNLEDAFAADPTLPDRVAGIHAMLGTVGAPGNVYVDGLTGEDPLEWNAFADPSAVAAVFATDVPISIVPLDATDDVPIPTDLADRLAQDHDAAGADLLYELLIRHPARLRADEGQQLWDELAALALDGADLVAWDDAMLAVGDDGRLVADETGRPVRYATSADRPAVEAALLEALRRGGPRVTPFKQAGSLTATWDGTTCALSVDGSTPGLYQLTYTGTAGSASQAAIAGVRTDHRWSDLTDWLAGVDLSQEEPQPPDWVIFAGELTDATGAGDALSGTVVLEPGSYGPICITGEWPDLVFHPGRPFDVEG